MSRHKIVNFFIMFSFLTLYLRQLCISRFLPVNSGHSWLTKYITCWQRSETDPGQRLVGLYASRTKGKWPDMPHVLRLAPAGWKAERLKASDPVQSYYEESGVLDQESSRTWAKLIAQVYEVDPLECPRCHSPMNVIAVITEPVEVRKILRHLVKIGRSPPGLGACRNTGISRLDPSFV